MTNNYTRPDWVNKAPIQYQGILEKHDMWLKNIQGGELAYLARADLSGANLSGTNLARANLARANFSWANFSWANLAKAYLAGANLSGTNLVGTNLAEADFRGAYLAEANLAEAYLAGANLSGANLSGTNLSGTNLAEAYLAEADLSGTNLARANLSGANLSGANLSGTNLAEADLSGTNLSGTNLSGTNLSWANLILIKQDFITSIALLHDEIPNLRNAIVTGKVDGSTYSGECACLCGTIANYRNIDISDEVRGFEVAPGLLMDSKSPRECFFMGIKKGDTPNNNQISKIVVEWIDEAFPDAKEEISCLKS